MKWSTTHRRRVVLIQVARYQRIDALKARLPGLLVERWLPPCPLAHRHNPDFVCRRVDVYRSDDLPGVKTMALLRLVNNRVRRILWWINPKPDRLRELERPLRLGLAIAIFNWINVINILKAWSGVIKHLFENVLDRAVRQRQFTYPGVERVLMRRSWLVWII
jgi:hypothetical protein